jgi:excinuclease ABC subunit A
MKEISIQGARQHNLRNLSVSIPRNRLTVITGLSGSGKSSLAFDTLFAEGQRRYIESLSTYARQFLEQLEKPDVDLVEGLSPAIAIEQKTTSGGARSTVGTITEIYDYLRLLYSSVGQPHCPVCGREVSRQSAESIVERILEIPGSTLIGILAPVVRGRKGEYRKLFEKYLKEGFMRARVDGKMHLLEDPPALDRQSSHNLEIVIDRLSVSSQSRQRIEMSVKHALEVGNGLVIISREAEEDLLFSEILACPECDIDIPALEPRSFSFNSRYGACPKCNGTGHSLQVNLERLLTDSSAPCSELEISLADRNLASLFETAVSALLDHFKIPPETRFNKALPAFQQALVDGLSGKIRFNYGGVSYNSRFDGLTAWFMEKMESTRSRPRKQQLREFMAENDCPACGGSRLKPESRAVRINGRSVSDFCRMPLKQALREISAIRLSPREQLVAEPVLREILERIRFLVTVGLDYLSLERRAETLSAGEAQRVRLATQVGSRLQGVLYVLDEPSIGLHPRDTKRLIGSLAELRDLGNTVVVVEHDEETIRAADYLIDLGPGAGSMGGELIAAGSVSDLENCPRSLTGA